MNTPLKLMLAALLSLDFTARATDALQNVTPQNSGGFLFAGAGFSFVPTTNFTVTALGYRFNSSSNDASYVVNLLDAETNVLATATINAGASNAVQLSYTNIASVALMAGSTNFLVGYDAVYFASNNAAKLWAGSLIDARDEETGSFDVASEIEYLGACTNTTLVGETNAPYYLFVGPNFQLTTEPIVEPSLLTITLTSSNTVQLSWPETDTLGQLQSTTNLNVPMIDVTNAPVVVSPNQMVELPLVPPQSYFRLSY